MLLRKQAASTSRYYCKQNTETERLSNEELLESIRNADNSHLADSIARYSTHIRGSRPYWKNALGEIKAFTYDLGKPSVFFTVSAADLQWWDLQLHMPNASTYQDPNKTEKERARIAWQNLQDKPHIAADYLSRRWRLFFNIVIKKKFAIIDWWYRYEWQARGSGHIHSFL